jgi:hypothetical protein
MTSIKEKYSVKSIDNFICKDWLLNKHYAKRIPSISYAFGLFNSENLLSGVVCYGRPVAHILVKNAFGGEYQEQFLELNRLVVNEGMEKNTLSFFVAESLKMLPKPQVLVSYADSSQNHHGYIYQATNWFYTGLSAEFQDYMVKGLEHMHPASVMDLVGRSDGEHGHINKVEELKKKFGEENVYMVDRPRKHRYFYFLGNKKEVKKMKSLIKYEEKPYPKGENKRYDASYQPSIQTQLF